MTYRVIQWASGGVGRAAMQGVLGPSRPRSRRVLGASPEKDGVDIGTLLVRSPIGVSASTDVEAAAGRSRPTACSTARSSPTPRSSPASWSRARTSSPRSGWFYPPDAERERLDAVCQEAGVTLHGTGIHPGGITERFPLGHLRSLGFDHPCAGRGVLRHPHLRCARRHPRLDALRQDARGGPDEHHGRRPRGRLPPVGVDGGRRAGLRPRSRTAHHPRHGGGHGAHRLAHRPHPARHGGRPALPLGGTGGRRGRDHRRRQLAHGRGRPRPGLGVRSRRANASRWRSPATRTSS